MSAADKHYRLAASHIRASEGVVVNDDDSPAEQQLEHLHRIELMLGGLAHAILFVGCVEATRPTPTPLTKLDGSLRKTLADD